jgi:GNAT superfamily N-acetyltransferase
MHSPGIVALTEAQSPADITAVRELFIEYAVWLGFSLAYQNFGEELTSLPGKYTAPNGRLILARVDDAPAACGAFRQLHASVCEMMRLFVKPEYRGGGLGRRVAEKLIGDARVLG